MSYVYVEYPRRRVLCWRGVGWILSFENRSTAQSTSEQSKQIKDIRKQVKQEKLPNNKLAFCQAI